MDSNTIRLLLVAGAVWFALYGDKGSPARQVQYAGRLSSLHSEARSMQPEDRAVLAEALDAASSMLAADKKNLVGTTQELQRYIQAVTEFDYLGVGKPTEKYPRVAELIQAELVAAYGRDEAQVTPETKAKVVEAMAEAGRALR